MTSVEALIVGAGPVGLLLGGLLGHSGIETLLIEKRPRRAPGSRAIGVTPTSLGILGELGLAEGFLSRGVQIREAAVHGEEGLLARLRIPPAAARYPYILSLPQADTEALLLELVSSLPGVRLRTGLEACEVVEEASGLRVLTRDPEGGQARFAARVVCVCDGAGSPLAVRLGLRRRLRRFPVAFRMADYKDSSGLGEEAHLYFSRKGSVESFPIGGGRRRWIAQAEGEPEPSFEKVERAVGERAGVNLLATDRIWASSFRPERSELERFHLGRVVFCGDAAHTMPPIGGQGMNTGFADARLLALLLVRWLRGRTEPGELLAIYSRYRPAAFRAAARRSRLFMGVGTIRAPVLRQLRDQLVPVLTRPPLSSLLAGHFTMMNVPFSTLDAVLRREHMLGLGSEGQAHEPPGG